MYLDGQKLVDNNGCHGEQEKSSGDTFVAKGTHRVTVDMCEMGGGEVGVFPKLTGVSCSRAAPFTRDLHKSAWSPR